VKYISAYSQFGTQCDYIHVEAELLHVFGFITAEELVFGDAGLFVVLIQLLSKRIRAMHRHHTILTQSSSTNLAKNLE
jgi:hypothetical protein